MVSYEDKVNRARLVAACGLQKAYRGFRDREKVRMILWKRFERAASVIQTKYRKWRDEKKVSESIYKALPKDREVFRACCRATPLRQRQKLKFDMDNQEPTSTLFRKCLRGAANHKDKMEIWRAIIELRRGHPYWSTHVAFKAMIESRGNLERSLSLMSDETYALKNEQDVPMQLQKLFIPSAPAPAILPGQAQVTVIPTNSPLPSFSVAMGPETFNRPSSPANTAASVSASLALGGGAAGISGIRNIRTSKAANHGSALDYTHLLVRNYFSKHYAGNAHNAQNPCKKPNGFEPHTFTPLTPRGEGAPVPQATNKNIRHGMHPIELEQPRAGSVVPALNWAEMSMGLGVPVGGAGGKLGSSQTALSTITASGNSREPTPRDRIAKNTTPRRDTELLAGLLQLQQQMDALAR